MFQQHSAPVTQRGRESGNTENQDHPGLPRRKSTGKEERKRGRKRRFAPSHTRFRAQPSAAGRAARQSREPPAGMSPCSPGCWRPRLPPRSCCSSSWGQPLWHFRGRRGFASVLLNNMVVTRASVVFQTDGSLKSGFAAYSVLWGLSRPQVPWPSRRAAYTGIQRAHRVSPRASLQPGAALRVS